MLLSEVCPGFEERYQGTTSLALSDSDSWSQDYPSPAANPTHLSDGFWACPASKPWPVSSHFPNPTLPAVSYPTGA